MTAAATLTCPLVAHAQDLTPVERAKVDAIVVEGLQASGVPSASVAIVRGGRVVLAKAYGKQSERGGPASPDAPYQIASVSKQFTAAAILLLRDEGKLSLDDTVAKWLPGVTDGAHITIRQLLSHTAGLQDYWPQDYLFTEMRRPVTPQAIVDRWGKKPLDYPSGTQWQYSNTGYVVAGLIIEKAAGEPLLAYLQRRVFAPLRIHGTDQDKAVGAGYPQGYHRYALGPVRVAAPPARGWLFAAGELSMTARDLATWDLARLNRTILTPADWAEQETTVKLADGKDTHYGLGVFVQTRADHRSIEHDGEAVGFLTTNAVFPDDKAAIVVAVNADFGRTQDSIATAIAKLILPAPAATATTVGNEAPVTASARAFFDQLGRGEVDRARLTEHCAEYFDAQVRGDYRSSLTPLGMPASFALAGPARLRGGFVNRNYLITYPDGRKLIAVTYAEPGGEKRYEQYLVMPAA